MPSVVVSWGGTCRDPDVRSELLAHLEDLARRSEARLGQPTAKRPAILEKLNAIGRDGLPDLPAVVHHDRPIAGNLLVDPDVAADPSHALDEADRLGLARVPLGEDPDGDVLIRLESAHLTGIDFRLFDPRDLYPGQDRVSFVFFDCPELPSLDGRIAQVADRDRVQLYRHEAIRSADWFVTRPGLHLRYYLEDWSDQFFAWVKSFFVDDLTYWRGEPMPGYADARDRFDQLAGSASREVVKLAVFHALLDWFDREADRWIADMATW